MSGADDEIVRVRPRPPNGGRVRRYGGLTAYYRNACRQFEGAEVVAVAGRGRRKVLRGAAAIQRIEYSSGSTETGSGSRPVREWVVVDAGGRGLAAFRDEHFDEAEVKAFAWSAQLKWSPRSQPRAKMRFGRRRFRLVPARTWLFWAVAALAAVVIALAVNLAGESATGVVVGVIVGMVVLVGGWIAVVWWTEP